MFLPLRDHNPTERTPFVTIALIVVNVLVFFREWTLGPEMGPFIARWGAIPYELTHMVDLVGRVEGTALVHVPGPAFLPVTAVTSLFLHGGWLHLAMNMLYLWIFGNNVEDFLGHARFLAFYLIAGLAGLAAHVFVGPDSILPTVGASGAISGMLGAYLVLYPRARITSLLFLVIFVQLVRVPAVLLIALWMVMQVLGGVIGIASGGSAIGGVAYWAHLGGFAIGFLAMRVFFRQRVASLRMRSRWRQLDGRFDDPWS